MNLTLSSLKHELLILCRSRIRRAFCRVTPDTRENSPEYIGNTFSIEQLLADEVTRGIIIAMLTTAGTTITKKTLNLDLKGKILSLFKAKLKSPLMRELAKYAAEIEVKIGNSKNVNVLTTQQKDQNRKTNRKALRRQVTRQKRRRRL